MSKYGIEKWTNEQREKAISIIERWEKDDKERQQENTKTENEKTN